MIGVRIPGGARLFLLLNVHSGSGAHQASYSIGTAVFSWNFICKCEEIKGLKYLLYWRHDDDDDDDNVDFKDTM